MKLLPHIIARFGKIKKFAGIFIDSPVSQRAAALNALKDIPEHGIVGFLPVKQKINGFANIFVVYLPVKVFIDYLGTLLGGNIGEEYPLPDCRWH